MSKKKTQEWFVDCPWGKLCMVSWGDPANPPILAVHGYMDSAATFIPLIESLPDSFFYVAIDLPGHGRSDPFPKGFFPTQVHLVEAVRIAIKRLDWDRFIYMAHSMATNIGVFYNAVFSGQITKIINLDPVIPLNFQVIVSNPVVMTKRYEEYYETYDKFNNDNHRLYSYDQAINAVARSRNLTTEQADVVLSRVLIPAGNGLFRLSWDQKMKRVFYLHLPRETFKKMLTTNSPPVLNILANEIRANVAKRGLQLMQEVQDLNDRYLTVFVTGGHDVHLTHPESVAEHVKEFLERDFNINTGIEKKCKL